MFHMSCACIQVVCLVSRHFIHLYAKRNNEKRQEKVRSYQHKRLLTGVECKTERTLFSFFSIILLLRWVGWSLKRKKKKSLLSENRHWITSECEKKLYCGSYREEKSKFITSYLTYKLIRKEILKCSENDEREIKFPAKIVECERWASEQKIKEFQCIFYWVSSCFAYIKNDFVRE